MKIDAHQHFWYYEPEDYGWISEAMPQLQRDLLPEDLQPLLEQAGFEGCIAVQARQSEDETDFLVTLSQEFSFIRGIVGWVDLQDPGVRERLQYYRQFRAVRGFRHIVQDEPDERFLVGEDFLRGVRMLGEFGYTYDILVYEKHLPVVVEFLEKCPDQPFVLDHLGKPEIPKGMSERWREGIRAIAAHQNVSCKLSGLVTEADWQHWTPDDFRPFLEHALEAFGPDRLMIGSDWPVCLLEARDYAQVTGIVEDFISPLPAADQEKILGLNAARFYGV